MLRKFIFTFVALMGINVFADGLDPIGKIAYCQKEQRDAFSYLYNLEKAAIVGDNVEVDILVRNFVCSKARENGDTVYFWKLVKDKTFTVEASAGSLFRKEFRYKETDVNAVYRAHISIPVEHFLSIVDQQTLQQDGAVNVRRATTFKHHSNFGWVSLGAYALVLDLHIRKSSPSFLEVIQFTR